MVHPTRKTKRLSRMFALSVVAAALLGGPAIAKSAGPALPAELLVQLDQAASLTPLLQKYPLTLKAQLGARPIYRLGLVGGASVDATVSALAAERGVLEAEPNLLHQNPEARRTPIWALGTSDAYVAQWGPGAVGLAAAHKAGTGAGVTVAVLDTGVDGAHPALAGRLVPGFDFVDGDTDPSETGSLANLAFGHGTHVAGIVALVALGARIMPLRVLDADGGGDAWTIGAALLHAADPDGNPATDDGAQVANLSLGTVSRTRILRAVERLASCSVPLAEFAVAGFGDAGYNADRDRCARGMKLNIAAAAGNAGSATDREYPAAERGVYGLLAVAASQADASLAPFSNAGNWIDLAAPGAGVTSTVPGGGYGVWSGTSMATPFVAGTLALVRGALPAVDAAEAAKRIADTTRALCGTKLRQVDAAAAMGVGRVADPACR